MAHCSGPRPTCNAQTGTTRYDLLSGYGDMAVNEAADSISGHSGIAGFSAVGAMVDVEGFFPAATGHSQPVGDSAFKYCFAAGTLVLLADGTRQAIETLKAGQEVWAAHEGRTDVPAIACRIEEVFHVEPSEIWEVHLVGDQVIRTTAGHVVFAKERGWIKVEELKVGDRFQTQQGEGLFVEEIVPTQKGERNGDAWRATPGSDEQFIFRRRASRR